MRLIVPLLFLFLPLGSLAEPALFVARQTPPPFGLGVGSVIRHRIDIFAPLPWQLDQAQLPSPGSVNDWLEIRSLDLQTTTESEGIGYLLEVEYQIFPPLKNSSELEIPPLPLYFLSPAGTGPQRYEIPAWRFTAAPLIPADIGDNDIATRPLWRPEPLALSPHPWRLTLISVGLLMVMSAQAWRRRWFPWQRRPFSRALSGIRRAVRQRQTERAFRLFHQALNETAGHAVFGEGLSRFLQQHPQFQTLEAELKCFFEDSRSLFFDGRSEPKALERIVSLCRACIQADKRCRK